MKKLVLLCFLCAACRCFAADGLTVFQSGLQAFRQSGPEGLLSGWFAGRDDPDKLAKLRERFATVTRSLGGVVETEAFAPYNIGAHLQRLYGVVYFEKRPLWIRAEYYSIGERSGFISLDFSLSPDEILPITRPVVP
jgi:hypothetical protein